MKNMKIIVIVFVTITILFSQVKVFADENIVNNTITDATNQSENSIDNETNNSSNEVNDLNSHRKI